MKISNQKKIIFERVYVETPVDTDHDGKTDLIAVYISRPETDDPVPAVMVADPYMMFCNEDWYDLHNVDRDVTAYTPENGSFPDVVAASGAKTFGEYIDLCARQYEAAPRNVTGHSQAVSLDRLPDLEAVSDLYRHLNQRGYAAVLSGGLGTRGSDGFTFSGSPEEIAAFRSIIDWLNGRTHAFTDKESGIEVKADWCTGNVAMSGKSYLGTLCFGVAATGVPGLKTIIPEAGISNWYNYYRYNGLCVAPFDWQGDDCDLLSLYCMSRALDPEDFERIEKPYRDALDLMVSAEDRELGNYNYFWDQRNYLRHASEFNASVFIIHGINDWNVKTDHAVRMFRELMKHGKECRMMLHQGEHIYIYDLEGSDCLGAIDRWLDHYLLGEDNGAEKEPAVMIENNLDQNIWHASETWPPEGTKLMKFPVDNKEDMLFTITDKPITDQNPTEEKLTETDSRKIWRDYTVLGEIQRSLCVCGNDNSEENDLHFSSDHFGNTGIDEDEIQFCSDRFRNKGIEENDKCFSTDIESPESCLRMIAGPFDSDVRISGSVRVSFRASTDRPAAILSAMLVDLGESLRIDPATITMGIDPDDPDRFIFGAEHTPSQYKIISRGWLNTQNKDNPWSKADIDPGKFYDYMIDMVETDHILPRGHKLELILYGADWDYTFRPLSPTEITYDLSSIDCSVPVSHGRI